MLRIQRHHIIITTLLLILIGTLWFSWVLFKQAETYYIQLNATRLSPLGLHAFSEETVLPTDKETVVLFGDSRAAQWPRQDNVQYAFVNRGIGAQTSIQVAKRYNAHVKPISPDILILQVGINDLKTIGLFPDDAQLIISRVEQSIDRIVMEAEADGALVIVTTIFPTGEIPLQRRPFWSNSINTALLEVNDHIHALESDTVLIFDSYSILVDENGRLSENFAADELHLNQAGYRQLNWSLNQFLKSASQSNHS